MITTLHKYIKWWFIYSNYDTISELAIRSHSQPNTKDVPRYVLSHTTCLLWYAAKVLGQVGGKRIWTTCQCMINSQTCYICVRPPICLWP